MMALSPKAWGRNILWPHAKLLPASISFVESAEGQCLLTVWRVGGNRRIPEQIGSPVDNKGCLQFLLRMAPRDDGNYCFEPCWVEVERRIGRNQSICPSILLPRLWYFFVRTQIVVESNFYGGWRRSAMVVR